MNEAKVVPEIHANSENELSDEVLATELASNCYKALLAFAKERRRRANFSDTMMTDDILHDAFLKLSKKTVWQSKEQFYRTASLAIRQVVVDHARQKLSLKRGGQESIVPFQETVQMMPDFNESPEEIVMLDTLLEKLTQKQPRLTMIVNARYFAAMTEEETALALNISQRTVRRDWQTAKSWLFKRMYASH